jgi:hypothetical protein
MALKFTYLGFWLPYEPETRPEQAPPGALFLRRESDGLDFYAFARDRTNFPVGSLALTAYPTTRGVDGLLGNLVQAIVRDDPQRVFPANGHLVLIEGHPLDDAKPWAAYEQRRLVLDPLGVEDWPEVAKPPVVAVSATQAKIQLFRTKFPDGSDLLSRTEALVEQSTDRELKLWFAGAGTWQITNPNVQAIGAGFNLTPEQIQALFDQADLIAA